MFVAEHGKSTDMRFEFAHYRLLGVHPNLLKSQSACCVYVKRQLIWGGRPGP